MQRLYLEFLRVKVPSAAKSITAVAHIIALLGKPDEVSADC
ncbi:MAG: hypothetical protein ACXWQO_05025 [Bdellovibrionota bacterium]